MDISITECHDVVVCHNCGCVVYKWGARKTEDSYICPCCKESIPK